MGRVVIELTNRCNLGCHHCFSGRHGGGAQLSCDIVERILAEARECGFEHICFTGGEPTLHTDFQEIIRHTHESGYDFSFVSNGHTFGRVYRWLEPYRDRLQSITFSCDGARESTHDRLRGAGSFRRVAQAMSICVASSLPFTINMVVTRENVSELESMASLAARLGSKGLRVGHLMTTPSSVERRLDLMPDERKQVEALVRALAEDAPIPIEWAPGTHATDLFPCAPLNSLEVNVDCHGRLTKCCHLSGHGEPLSGPEVIADLDTRGFAAALQSLFRENKSMRERKLEAVRERRFEDRDFFACWQCMKHYGKLDWLERHPGHPWTPSTRRGGTHA